MSGAPWTHDQRKAGQEALNRLARFTGRYGVEASTEDNLQSLEDLTLLLHLIGDGDFYIVFTETNEDPMPMRGPFPSFDAAVEAHFEAEVEAGNGPETDETPHMFYLHDDNVRIGRLS